MQADYILMTNQHLTNMASHIQVPNYHNAYNLQLMIIVM